jgi:hypothetical protein
MQDGNDAGRVAGKVKRGRARDHRQQMHGRVSRRKAWAWTAAFDLCLVLRREDAPR